MSNNNRNMYACISRLGRINSPTDDGLTYSLVQTLDKDFLHSPLGNQYSQSYMAERCSKDFDGFCAYYAVNTTSKSYPNTQQSVETRNEVLEGLTVGETLIGNSAERRFCDFSTCRKVCQPLDPTVADSATVCYYDKTNEDGTTFLPVCSVDPKTIDEDIVMNLCLQKPARCMSTMKNICNNSRRTNVSLEGTKLGRFCDQYNASQQGRN